MSAAEIRAWGTENGWTVQAKGPLPAGLKEAYSAAQAVGGNGAAAPVAPVYPPGMADSDFAEDAADDPDPFDVPAETPPRPVSPKARPHGLRSILPKRSAPSKPGRPSAGKSKTRAKPRSSTAELAASTFRILAKAATPMPPLYRTLRLQSVVVGPVWDQHTAGTFIDKWLQPLARLTEAGDVVAALTMPELGIGAASWHLAQCGRAGIEPNPVVLQMAAEVTRHGFMALMRVGGDEFAAQLARERDDEMKHGPTVDAIMAFVMAPPGDPAAEEEAIARMVATLAGEPAPAGEPEPATMPA